jgi:leucyl aminopeptidase
MNPFLTDTISSADVPVFAMQVQDYSTWLHHQEKAVTRWLETTGFVPKIGEIAVIPASDGGLRGVVLILAPEHNLWYWAALVERVPEGFTYYHLPYQGAKDKKSSKLSAKKSSLQHENDKEVILGWLLGTYRFTKYKTATRGFASLRIAKKSTAAQEAIEMAEAIFLVRDLINRPANDLTPSALAKAAKKLAKRFDAEYHEIRGEELIKKNYPTIYLVGKAAEEEPRLVDLRWNQTAQHLPLITLVGKGVCFDSGGLNIKTGSGMVLMKKDMGGAAAALGLAQMIMQSKLAVRLRVLLPIVENSIAGNAFRPQDVVVTRKGISVEIGNTDAEGRLILCDALAEADAEKPDLLLDMATLTGASRVALGPDIPSFFTPAEGLAKAIEQAALEMNDPVWRLPLWHGYDEYLTSSVADINNAGSSGYAGAITAALFLNRFVTETTNWVHVDMMAWNVSSRAGRPVGGEAQALRTLFHFLKVHYG